MREVITRPILFKGDMVRAILDGSKTETRRIMKPQPTCIDKWCNWGNEWATAEAPQDSEVVDEWRCPYGQLGDKLWVRETFKVGAWRDKGRLRIAFDYRASPELVNTPWCYPPTTKDYTNQILKAVYELDNKGIEPEDPPERIYHWEAGKSPLNWKPSIFMPRWASRITLEVTEISVERVQDITEEGAWKEGVKCKCQLSTPEKSCRWNRNAFKDLWDSINKKRGYPWGSNPWVWVVKFRRILQ